MGTDAYEIQGGERYWTVDGSPDFGIVPAGTLDFLEQDAPIRLFEGNDKWGSQHISLRHGLWLRKIRRTVPQALWDKCGQVGKIYRSKGSYSFHMTLAPSCLMILRYFQSQNFFSVTTLYEYQRAVQGTQIARYPSTVRGVGNPDFALVTPPPVKIEVKNALTRVLEDALDPDDIERLSKPRTRGILTLNARQPSNTNTDPESAS